MADCLKEIGKSIITQCLWPPIKSHIDYWWCFDDNIQVLKNGVRDLDRETLDINQKIEEARLRTDNLRPEVQEWSKAGTEKLGEARRILQDDINPKAWNLISRYSIGKRAKKAAEQISKHRNEGNFNVVADPAPASSMGYTTDRSIMDFESRKRIEEDIIKSLKESNMIGICGMGGVGKTTMAQRIRERVMEEKEIKLFDEVVMVVVSQPIDMLKIQEEIADLLKLEFDKRSMSARADKLRKRLMDNKRKIVIFDDVWESFKLEDLGVPSGFEGCKIILTTRSKDVCKKMEVQKIIAIEILSEKEPWILFKEKAGNCVEDSTLLSVAKDVVAECKGLPIALVTVGKALRDQKKKSIWEDSLSQLREANPADFPDVLADVYNPLKLSYDHLDNERERLLFLLCCLFPEDYDIDVEDLTLYFMGLRKFDGSPRIEEARNRMDTLVEKLKSRFLLIEGQAKHHVKMHDVVRDVAIYIGSKEKLCLAKSLNKISIENSSDINVDWMSVDISNEPMNVDMGLRFPKLRLLMLLNLSSDISSEEIGDLGDLKNLNVLSFSNISTGSLPPPTLGLLQNLRTLYLRHCNVEDISVIGELVGLEILCCHSCYGIKELPAEIGRLNRLRLMELNECHQLRRIAFGILSNLVRLEKLKLLRSFDGWESEENGKEKRNASVRELESLPNLTCLEIHISDSNLAAQQIRLSPKLVKYKIYIRSKYNLYEDTGDYEKIMSLKLPSDIGAVEKWIQILVNNTECLFLEGDGSNNINLEECQVHLRNLDIRECSTLKKVVKTKSGIVFPMLERLHLWRLDNLEEIIWDGTIILNQNNVSSLSNLKYVGIDSCSKLRYLFSVSVATTCLLQLEELWISNCSAMEQVFRNDINVCTLIEFPKLKKLTLVLLPNLEEMELTLVLSNLKSVTIGSCSKLRYLLSVSVATTCLLQLEYLWIEKCEAMEQVFRNDVMTDHGCTLIEFPKLKILGLENLRNLTSFCQGIENIKFPQLTFLGIGNLPKLNSFCRLNSETNPKKVVKTRDCNSGIVFPMLERLRLWRLENIEGIIWDGTIILNQNNVSSSLSNLKSVQIQRCSKLRYLLSVSVATTCLSQLEELVIIGCSAMEQVFRNDITDHGCTLIEFPKLKKLELGNLPNLIAFCQGIENIKFPQLTDLEIGELPKLNSETPHDDTNPFHFLCNPKVEIGCLKNLDVRSFNYNNIRNIWCDQIPFNLFNNLEKLYVDNINGIMSLISFSIAKNLVSLKILRIERCSEMVEVIESNDDDKEVVDIKCLFPTLKTLKFEGLLKLRRFWQLNHTLEFSLLEEVIIWNCPVMETFTLGSLNTPNFKSLRINWQIVVNMKDLNDTLRHHFVTKNQNTSMIEEDYNEDANRDGDKDENKIEYNNENVNKDEDKNEDVNKDEEKK